MYSNRSPPTLPAGTESPCISIPARRGIEASAGVSNSRRYSSMLMPEDDVVTDKQTANRLPSQSLHNATRVSAAIRQVSKSLTRIPRKQQIESNHLTDRKSV